MAYIPLTGETYPKGPTRNNQDQTVKIAFKDEDVNIPLGEVSATSHNAKKVIVTIRKANGLPRKHEMLVQNPSVENTVKKSLAGETASSIELQFVPNNDTSTVYVKNIEMKAFNKTELTRNNKDQTVNIVLKDADVNNSLGEISATSHNAKKVIFTIKNPNGQQWKHETTVRNPSRENTVKKNFTVETASSIELRFLPANDTSTVYVRNLEIKACKKNETNLAPPNPANVLEELPSTSYQCSSTAEFTADDLNQAMNEDLEATDGIFPVGKITVRSQNAKKVIFTITKLNGEHQEIEKTLTVTDPPEINSLQINDFNGKMAFSVQIRLIPSNQTTCDYIKEFIKAKINKIGSKCCGVCGLVFTAVVLSLMIIHRLNVCNNYCSTDFFVILFFLIPNIFGCIGFILLIQLRYKNSSVRNRTNDFSFSKFKLILMFIFGLGYLLHSGLYVWKHTFPEDCHDNSWLDLTYDIFSMVYIVIVFIYFVLFYDRKLEETVKKHCCVLTYIIVANVCIWLNAISFESNFLYDKHMDFDNSTIMENLTSSSHIVVEAIEKLDTFCSPAMVEFSLMVIDMLFTNNDDTEGSLNGKLLIKIDENWNKIVEILIQITCSLLAFAFFAFVLVIVLTTNASDNLLNHPTYFSVYMWFELIIKGIMVLLFVGVFMEFKHFTLSLNRSSAVLWVTSGVNALYHVVYFVVLIWGYFKNNYSFIIVPLIVNILSFILAICQTLFIQGIHSHSRDHQQCSLSKFVYYACFILGVFNLGLWICDSIGEDRQSVFSFIYYWANQSTWSSIVYTAVFPVTIFFRFQTGLDFLELFWEHETLHVSNQRRHSNTQLNN